ncbi:MAG: hypothetical protein WCT46_03460 [Candidatus Gracilibacteria bacterium]
MQKTQKFIAIFFLIMMVSGCGDTLNEGGDSLVSLEKVVSITPDDQYQYGAFCRVNYVSGKDEFLVTFGGANRNVQEQYIDYNSDDMPGGAEGGNGYSYKFYSVDDFEYTGETGILNDSGGDAAFVMVDDEYFYSLGGHGGEIEWVINKYDASTLEEVDNVDIDLAEGEITSDQMLAYANGYLIASSLYDTNLALGGDRSSGSATDDSGATHNHVYDTDLNLIDYFILDDTPHSNGGYVVFQNGVYNYITSTAFFGDLIVMQYDEDWNYLGVKNLGVYGQWAQGALYDEETEYFYVAYNELNKFGEDSYNPRGISLGIYDKNWNLVETVEVTKEVQEDGTKEGRPSVVLYDGKLYVSYDVSPADTDQDWQCEVSIYDVTVNL